MSTNIDTDTAMLILACAGAINHDYLKLIELMNVQVQALQRILGKRPRCTDVERARLARLADQIDRHVLALAETIVNPQRATCPGDHAEVVQATHRQEVRRITTPRTSAHRP